MEQTLKATSCHTVPLQTAATLSTTKKTFRDATLASTRQAKCCFDDGSCRAKDGIPKLLRTAITSWNAFALRTTLSRNVTLIFQRSKGSGHDLLSRSSWSCWAVYLEGRIVVVVVVAVVVVHAFPFYPARSEMLFTSERKTQKLFPFIGRRDGDLRAQRGVWTKQKIPLINRK